MEQKKVGVLTFHASHNYGSCLQAYALQTTLKKLGVQPEIINFRTARQKDAYAVFTKRKGLKYLLKNAARLLYYASLKKRHQLFENFIKKEYRLSPQEYATAEELETVAFDYQAVIAGSDQIWNPRPADFDWAYYLPFVKDVKKISYAPSFGPFFGNEQNDKTQQIVEKINKFHAVSVREAQGKAYLQQHTDKDITVTLDPTLLLTKEDWMPLVKSEPIVQGDYIFLYTLFSSPEINQIAKRLSKKLNTKVVVSNFSNQYDVITPYKKHFDTGPKEFLNLIYHAKFVLVTSFHGTVFSVLFEKPFLAINGDKDNRISNLLALTGLTDRTVHVDDVEEKAVLPIDFSAAESGLQKEREKSLAFLKNALELNDDDM